MVPLRSEGLLYVLSIALLGFVDFCERSHVLEEAPIGLAASDVGQAILKGSPRGAGAGPHAPFVFAATVVVPAAADAREPCHVHLHPWHTVRRIRDIVEAAGLAERARVCDE
eukprot:13259566-Alexandrium_andersonii.AAC.1